MCDPACQLQAAVESAEEKERVIAELKEAADQRLELVQRLDTEMRDLRAQLEGKEQANLQIARSAEASLAAADERLREIQRLDDELTRLRGLFEVGQRAQKELQRTTQERLEALERVDRIAQERLTVIQQLDAELQRERTLVRDLAFVGRVSASIVAEQQHALRTVGQPQSDGV